MADKGHPKGKSNMTKVLLRDNVCQQHSLDKQIATLELEQRRTSKVLELHRRSFLHRQTIKQQHLDKIGITHLQILPKASRTIPPPTAGSMRALRTPSRSRSRSLSGGHKSPTDIETLGVPDTTIYQPDEPVTSGGNISDDVDPRTSVIKGLTLPDIMGFKTSLRRHTVAVINNNNTPKTERRQTVIGLLPEATVISQGQEVRSSETDITSQNITSQDPPIITQSPLPRKSKYNWPVNKKGIIDKRFRNLQNALIPPPGWVDKPVIEEVVPKPKPVKRGLDSEMMDFKENTTQRVEQIFALTRKRFQERNEINWPTMDNTDTKVD